MKKLNIDCKRFMSLEKNKLVKILIEDFTATESVESALKTIIQLQPDTFVPVVVSHVITTLKGVAEEKVSTDEYFIFLTPEGELYDKSVLSG